MRYTPVELRHVKVGRGLAGYRRREVDELLDDVATSFEEVWAERGELADRLEDVEKALDGVKQRETLLASTLVVAEKAAAEAVESAKREAEVIVAEAHQEGRSITRAAQAERDRLFAEVRRVETLMRAALGIVEEAYGGPRASGDDADDERSWPRREDTREFEAVPVPEERPADGEERDPLPPAAALPDAREAPEDDADDGGPGEERDVAWG
jgi:cell division initiation protein